MLCLQDASVGGVVLACKDPRTTVLQGHVPGVRNSHKITLDGIS